MKHKILAAFLTVLMVMPSLACVMTLCPMRGAQAAVAQNDVPPCHRQAKKGELMLLKDCMGIDLMQADAVAFAPSHADAQPVFVLPTVPALADIALYQAPSIRGPPVTHTSPPPDILLTTLRLRI